MKHLFFIVITLFVLSTAKSQEYQLGVDLLQYSPSIGYMTDSYLNPQFNVKNDVKKYALTWISMASAVKALKISTHVERPDGSDFNSFPSGHAAVSFMGAELLRDRYSKQKEIWIPSYVVATLVSCQRVKFNHHRPLEVISGALIGIASVHIAKLIEKRFLNRRKD